VLELLSIPTICFFSVWSVYSVVEKVVSAWFCLAVLYAGMSSVWNTDGSYK